ncbi:MAG: GTPase Era [Peptococcaceae bacterium]|jgi:GTP-binding protein Era|nr:GTPase Era [Peptococcaceae bacterium]
MSDTGTGHRFGAAALIGRPNAGKSTLLNYLVGEKIAIVTDKPQTTRSRIMGILTQPGWQMVVYDTPGIHKPKDRLGRNMVETALGAAEAADVVYYIVDAAADFGPGEARLLQMIAEIKRPVFLILNKADLLPKEALLPIIAAYSERRAFAEIVPLSALLGDNVPALLAATAACLPPGPPCYSPEEMTDQPERVIAAEMIREKAILATRQEVPYGVAVLVERMVERRPDLTDIYGLIIVERDSQKGILIGKGGRTLKWIGAAARREIEAMLGVQVNLQLWVRVKEDWRNQPYQLRRLGLE